jgi:hypothetical protein
MHHLAPKSPGSVKVRRHALAIALGTLFAAAGSAHAFEIDTGNPDVSMRWDNTVRYNLGVREKAQDPAILGNANFDDGDRNFSKGSIVTNRVDLLSEFDLVFNRSYGMRVSAAGWADAAYRSLDNSNTATANTLVNGLPVAGELSPYTKRYSRGPSGELLDAFFFTNFEAGDIPLSIKAGQHTVFWGDSLLLGGAVHSVSYGQNSLDLQKGFTTPGSEAKELFRPRGAITLQAQPANDLSVAAQWFYNWQAVRIPESGNYLTIQDGLNFGGNSVIVAPNPFYPAVPGTPAMLRAWNVSQTPPQRFTGSLGDFGLSARWNPEWLGGTMGFYARNATDILPQIMLTPGLLTGVPAAKCAAVGGVTLPGNACIVNQNATTLADLRTYGKFGTYQTAYGNDIHIFGVSLAKEIAGVSWGAELSYRENMPLQSNLINVLPAALVPLSPGAIATTAIPTHGTPGALGSTYHGLLNGFNVFPRTMFFDTATLQGELTWMSWNKVTQNEAVFKGNSSYTGIDKVTKNYAGLAFNFTPTWFQVLPGVDLSAPLTWSQGVYGNAAVQLGGNKGNGNWSAGIAADMYQKYKLQLSYNGYFGNYSTTATGAMNVANGTFAALSDRGWVSLTFKTTF